MEDSLEPSDATASKTARRGSLESSSIAVRIVFRGSGRRGLAIIRAACAVMFWSLFFSGSMEQGIGKHIYVDKFRALDFIASTAATVVCVGGVVQAIAGINQSDPSMRRIGGHLSAVQWGGAVDRGEAVYFVDDPKERMV